MDPRRALKGAMRRLVEVGLSIDGSVAELYQSTADVRPAHSFTLIRSARIQEGLREKLTIGTLVRVERTTQGMCITEIVGKPEMRNLNPLRIRHSPAAPTNFTISISSGTIKFRWDAPIGSKGKLKYYEILQADDDTGFSVRVFGSTASPSYAVACVDAPAKYYAVRAVDIWEQAGSPSNWEQVEYTYTNFIIGSKSKPNAIQASWAEYPEADAKYQVDIYREDSENPVHSAVVDATSFEYATDIPLQHTFKITTIMPTGDAFVSGESDPIVPDVPVADSIFTLSDSGGRSHAVLLNLLDVSWATEIVYAAETWHWVEFLTGGKIFDYITLVNTVPMLRVVIAATYDDVNWKFFGLTGHEGTRLESLGEGPLTDITTHQANYWLAQGTEGSRIAASWPKGFWRKIRVYFYSDVAVGMKELIVDQRIVVGFLEALYEIITGGEMVARGEGGSSVHIGYWSHDEADFGIYATDISGRPFFVLNIPNEYLRIGFPGGKDITIENGDIHMDGGMLEAGTVIASAISADSLSAISANLGSITSGEIVMGAEVEGLFTGIKIVYPTETNPGIGIYREGVLQAILSSDGYIQFGEATIDADGIHQPMGPGQWTAFNELGVTSWTSGEASVYDLTESFRLYNDMIYPENESDENWIIEIDSRFQQSPTTQIPKPSDYNSWGVKVSPNGNPTEFFVGDNLVGIRTVQGTGGKFVICEANANSYPIPAPFELDMSQGELVILRGYGRVIAKVPNSLLFVCPATPGTDCDLIHQGASGIRMPGPGWIRRMSAFNSDNLTNLAITVSKNGVAYSLLNTIYIGRAPTARFVGLSPNPDNLDLLEIETYPYTIQGETAYYSIIKPIPGSFDFMPGDLITVHATCAEGIPTDLQVWIQFLM